MASVRGTRETDGRTEPTTTQLRELYAALTALHEHEQMLLAKQHATRPKDLINRFLHSVRDGARREVDPTEAFHDPRDPDLPDQPVAFDRLISTFDFASHLPGVEYAVDGHPELGFSYVAREVFPGRRKREKRRRMVPRTLDLLLSSADRKLPIIGEVKIRGDSLTYFAFVQALMHVAELVAPLQRERLATHYEGRFDWPPTGPYADLYLISYEPPKTGANRDDSFTLSKQIAEAFEQDAEVGRHVRRIAFIEAEQRGDQLGFVLRYPE